MSSAARSQWSTKSLPRCSWHGLWNKVFEDPLPQHGHTAVLSQALMLSTVIVMSVHSVASQMGLGSGAGAGGASHPLQASLYKQKHSKLQWRTRADRALLLLLLVRISCVFYYCTSTRSPCKALSYSINIIT